MDSATLSSARHRATLIHGDNPDPGCWVTCPQLCCLSRMKNEIVIRDLCPLNSWSSRLLSLHICKEWDKTSVVSNIPLTFNIKKFFKGIMLLIAFLSLRWRLSTCASFWQMGPTSLVLWKADSSNSRCFDVCLLGMVHKLTRPKTTANNAKQVKTQFWERNSDVLSESHVCLKVLYCSYNRTCGRIRGRNGSFYKRFSKPYLEKLP